jgi:hypothetical protein
LAYPVEAPDAQAGSGHVIRERASAARAFPGVRVLAGVLHFVCSSACLTTLIIYL